MDKELRDRLVAMATHDAAVRERLAADGSLFDGYHPEMQAVHDANADEFEAILLEQGWPDQSLVAEDGSEAAWLIVQHAIARPDLQRRVLTLLEAAAARGDVPAWQPAFLSDRIRTLEGRPQLYGTQFDWDANGEMSPLPIEDPAGVDARRAGIGLPPLAETIAHHRRQCEREPRPNDLEARQRAMNLWAIRVGWRSGSAP